MTLVEKINALTTPYGYGDARIHSSVDDSFVTLALRSGESVRLPRDPGDCPENVIELVADAAGALMQATAHVATPSIVEKAFTATNDALAALSALADGPGVAWAKGAVATLRRRVAALETVA